MAAFNSKQNGLSERLIKEIIDLAQKFQIRKLILFGSRARGDYKKTSDIDFAVSGGNIVGFSIALEEEANTLLSFDVVNIDQKVDTELLDSIKREGIIWYEEKGKLLSGT